MGAPGEWQVGFASGRSYHSHPPTHCPAQSEWIILLLPSCRVPQAIAGAGLAEGTESYWVASRGPDLLPGVWSQASFTGRFFSWKGWRLSHQLWSLGSCELQPQYEKGSEAAGQSCSGLAMSARGSEVRQLFSPSWVGAASLERVPGTTPHPGY